MADVTDATFPTEVIERSRTVPVVVDLWAEWCGPCTSLGPILEKVIGETQGMVELAKVDVDANPEVSKAFSVQSIPAVYAMRDGEVVDSFMGALPEADVVAFVQKLIDGSTPAAAAPEGDGTTISSPDGAVGEPEPLEVAAPLDPADVEAIEIELATLLTTVKGDDPARERYIELLDQLGADHPNTGTWRRKLTTALF